MLEVQGEWRAQEDYRGSAPSPHTFPVHPFHLAAPELNPYRVNWSFVRNVSLSSVSRSIKLIDPLIGGDIKTSDL